MKYELALKIVRKGNNEFVLVQKELTDYASKMFFTKIPAILTLSHQIMISQMSRVVF